MKRLQEERPPVVLDVRWFLIGPPGRQEYDQGHIPGAVFVDLPTELASEPGAGGRHPLPGPARLEQTLRRAGVTDGRTVVVYDADNASAAARAWWLLRWAGHTDVRVLDGGYAAWVADGGAVTTEEPAPAPGDFEVRPGAMPVLDADDAARVARAGRLLDARAPERYRGDNEPIDPRAGHIPGAVNAPFSEHVDENGRWRSASDLADRFARLGVGPAEQVGVYCGSGVTACSVLLALEHAGISNPQRPAALYTGSWSQWSSDPQRPAATGEEPG
ncbi:sulfurtransferase [Saccharopolyspora spinosporotrichia]|uniref:Sulfurtransferase n=2 Tax=Saccharopolyspora erythraea TaxID=1836 RepID=A0ABN1DJN4_SACER